MPAAADAPVAPDVVVAAGSGAADVATGTVTGAAVGLVTGGVLAMRLPNTPTPPPTRRLYSSTPYEPKMDKPYEPRTSAVKYKMADG
jgi:hypothetical protein